jgi:hypothetical protein
VLDLKDCAFFGHALPEPFVKLELEGRLGKAGLLPRAAGAEKKRLEEEWEVYRRALRNLGSAGGPSHVVNRVVAPLLEPLGYLALKREEGVETREGEEDGGWLLNGTPHGARLRAFAFDLGADLDAPSRRGRAYRFSPGRIAHRVLLATSERAGLLTNGLQLRLLLCDPARPESHIAFRLDRGSGGWAAQRHAPDSFRLLRALGSPAGLALLPDLTEAARLNQTTVTKSLRRQARAAVEGFVQELLDRPENAPVLAARSGLAKDLWREGLVLVYRLLFALKLEASADPARAFSFASTALWRDAYSPNAALGPVARKVLDEGAETGRLLEDGLRALFRLFSRGISSSELRISPLGGALFGEGTTPLLDALRWGERAVARLLVNLLWTRGDGKSGDLRVHDGTLDVEDLGRVYESLLELEPGVATEPMCRLRRQKLEVVVPLAQGEPYRAKAASPAELEGANEAGDDAADETGEDDEAPTGKTRVVRDEKEIRAGEFFLRVGLGRKATGSYYTPHPFVRFLVQETLGPQAAERSPAHEPDPGALLALSVLDPAMGSGHFLVEACRFLGERLYEACRLCDELAVQADEAAAAAPSPEAKVRRAARAAELRRRVEVLPDPDDLMVAYLPSRVAEGESAGLSQTKALALARRLVAVHCLYGVDKNPLAVELAKLALWLESYAEGLPLTFLDHRLVCGDSLTGPFFENLLSYPGSGQAIGGLFAEGLTESLKATLHGALLHVRDLDASVGKDVSDLEAKRRAKERLDAALAPFRLLAAAWSGGVMLGKEACDDLAYETLLRAVAEKGDPASVIGGLPRLAAMVKTGREGVPYDLVFPEVFHPDGKLERRGFDFVLGNPPWNKVKYEFRELTQLLVPGWLLGKERGRVAVTGGVDTAHQSELEASERGTLHLRRSWERFGRLRSEDLSAVRADTDLYQMFVERSLAFVSPEGYVGEVVSSGLFKNPADGYLRRALLARGSLPWVLHYVNLQRLFEELAPVIEFTVLVWVGAAAERAVVASDLVKMPGEATEWPPHTGMSELRRLVFDTGFFLGMTTPLESASWVSLLSVIEGVGVELGNDLHRTGAEDALLRLKGVLPAESDARSASAIAQLRGLGLVPSYSSRSMAQHDSLHSRRAGKWNPCVDYVADIRHPLLRRLLGNLSYYRLALRSTCGSPKTNQRSVVSCVLQPGVVATHSMWVDQEPKRHSHAGALALSGLLNAFVVDHAIRPRVTSNLGKELLRSLLVPTAAARACRSGLLGHLVLRLECNSHAYAPLWHEQVGDAWREPKAAFNWPVLEDDDARWAVRAAIDAVVADAYGLSRSQYAHVLSTFSHKSYPKAPTLCLAAFDELKAIGLDAFTRRHDPYHDLPLNEDLPKPVIDIPIPEAGVQQGRLAFGGEELSAPASPPRRPPRGRRQ